MKREKGRLVSEKNAILSVPPIGVREVVVVVVPPQMIAIHVTNRDDLCHAPSVPLPFEVLWNDLLAVSYLKV